MSNVTVNILFAEGFEEVEALTVVDILRRAGFSANMISISDSLKVRGSHGIEIQADSVISATEFDKCDMLVLPGGMPGTLNLKKSRDVAAALELMNRNKKYVAAICAAPTVLGEAGLLKDSKATCYPGMEDKLDCSEWVTDEVCVDGRFITSRGVGTAIAFALKIVEVLDSREKADTISESIVFKG